MATDPRGARNSSATVLVVGVARLRGGSEAPLLIELLLEADSTRVIDCDISPTARLLTTMMQDIVVGRELSNDLETIAREFESRYHGPWRAAVRAALENAAAVASQRPAAD